MNARAGVVTSQVVWFAALPEMVSGDTLEQKAKNAAAGFIVAGLASFAPDLDHGSSTAGRTVGARNSKVIRFLMGGHRMGTHSVFAVALAWLVTDFLIGNRSIANAVAVGWGSHILVDMLTVLGVGLLWPVWKKKTTIGWIVTGSRMEDVYVAWIKASGILVAVWYGYIAWPTVQAMIVAGAS